MEFIESNFSACVQGDDDNGACKSASDCLRTPVILRIVLENLSNDQLLQVSLVNKLWNFEARTVLKDRGSLIPILKSSSPCQNIPAFASDLLQMNIVPFSGIHIELEGRHGCEACESTGALLDLNLVDILGRLSCKSLTFNWPGNWEKTQKCQAFLLANKILQDFCGELESIILRLGPGAQDFIQGLLKDCGSFPKLKSLDVRAGLKLGSCTKLTKFLISRAPQLKTFYARCTVNLLENVLKGSSAVLVAGRPVNPFYNEIPEGLLGSLRLEVMLLVVKDQNFNVEKFNRIVLPLIENSKTTLTHLVMESVLGPLLTCRGIRLENVKELRIHIEYDDLENAQPRVLHFLKSDLRRMFPNVKKVVVDKDIAHVQVNNFVEQGSVSLNTITPDHNLRASIQELLVSGRVQDCDLPFTFQIFPDIQKLTINRYNGREIPYERIWEHCKGLKTLIAQQDSRLSRHMSPENLDSVFCGIFPEEVVELRTKDDEYLKSVNIVPVKPAITCFRDLRTFNLASRDRNYVPRRSPQYYANGGQAINVNSTFVFSKVTALVAFARMPNLSVTLHSNFPGFVQALRHVQAYAFVYLEDRHGNPVV